MEVLLLHTMTMVTSQLKVISEPSTMKSLANPTQFQRLRLVTTYLLAHRMSRIIRLIAQA